MEEWKDLLNTTLKIIFEDGENHVSKKVGLLIGVTDTHLILRTATTREGILLTKIVRFEEMRE